MPPRRLPTDSADYARWLADQIERHPAGVMRLSEQTAMFVGMALRGYAERLDARAAGDLQYVTTLLDDYMPHGSVVAATSRIGAAWAQFQAIIPDFPRAKRITLHQGARVLGTHPPGVATTWSEQMDTKRVTDDAELAAYVQSARDLYFLDECAIEIAEPPVVEKTADGARVLAWLPVLEEDKTA